MRRILITIVVGLLVSIFAALILFFVDFSGPMKRDAAFEAYVQTGNPSILPPRTLDRSLSSSNPRSHEAVVAWTFFSLVWLRQRTRLLLGFLLAAVTISVFAGLMWQRRRNRIARNQSKWTSSIT